MKMDDFGKSLKGKAKLLCDLQSDLQKQVNMLMTQSIQSKLSDKQKDGIAQITKALDMKDGDPEKNVEMILTAMNKLK